MIARATEERAPISMVEVCTLDILQPSEQAGDKGPRPRAEHHIRSRLITVSRQPRECLALGVRVRQQQLDIVEQVV